MIGKRKKIKCIYQSDDLSICAGCIDKGTTCLSQEYVEEQPPRDGGSSALGKRMGRVEMLLEKVMERVSRPPDENRTSHHPVDALASSTPTSMYDPQPQFRSSVFDEKPTSL
jgi:hypothetical protein